MFVFSTGDTSMGTLLSFILMCLVSNFLKLFSLSKAVPFHLRIVDPIIVVIHRGILHSGVPFDMLSITILPVLVANTSNPNVGWWPFIGILISSDGLSQVSFKYKSEYVTSEQL